MVKFWVQTIADVLIAYAWPFTFIVAFCLVIDEVKGMLAALKTVLESGQWKAKLGPVEFLPHPRERERSKNS